MILETVNETNTSESVLSVPVIVWPSTNVPFTDLSPKTNSVTVTPPTKNLNTSSTMAVASFIFVSVGLFACVIFWPIRFVASEVPTSKQRNIFLVSHLPSDTLNISSLGYFISAASLNSNLKNISLARFVPFDWYKDLIFLINLFLLIPVVKFSGIEVKNEFLNLDKKPDIVLSASA